ILRQCPVRIVHHADAIIPLRLSVPVQVSDLAEGRIGVQSFVLLDFSGRGIRKSPPSINAVPYAECFADRESEFPENLLGAVGLPGLNDYDAYGGVRECADCGIEA